MRPHVRISVLLVSCLALVGGCRCDRGVAQAGGDDAGLDAGDGSGTSGDAGADADAGFGGGDAGPGNPLLAPDGGCGLNSCARAQATCGFVGDGCGLLLDCGSCTAPTTCGGGGVPNTCGGTAGCVKRTCAAIGADCGPQSDGCGGLLNCGACALPETCGGGGVNGRCGLPGNALSSDGGCVPTTCATAHAQCGIIGDGCGGVLSCGGCTGGTACGGGGVPYKCGGGNTCRLRTCATADAGCGLVGDGCGGVISCGSSCVPPMTCGGGGQPNQCGGGVNCVPRSCAQADAGCGPVGDGCGGLIQCGSCTTGVCGAGGQPNQCGGASACAPKTLGQVDAGCGFVGDGCGGLLDAGTCATGTCGGGGVANHCGAPAVCVPKTCAQLGKNCGPVGDGCGGLTVDCGTCTGVNVCGGGGVPSVCGSTIPDGGAACTNLCLNQVACTTGTTTVVGTVYAPTDPLLGYGNPDPLPGALVYVPNAPLQPLTLLDGGTPDGGPEVSCDKCSAGVSGNPLVTATSGVDGTFTLSNVPCGPGVAVPVVIQVGKWRRVVTLSNVVCCATNTLLPDQSRLPRRQFEGSPSDNIPLIAVVTGGADHIEDVLPKLGIDPTLANGQYTIAGGQGRVRFYVDNGFNKTSLLAGGGTMPPSTQLYDSLAEMMQYDMIIIDCVGQEVQMLDTQRANLEAYANMGGRIFASHFAYVWLYDRAVSGGGLVTSPISFTGTATWNVNQQFPPDQDAYIDTSFGKGVTFAQWVQLVGASAASSTPAVPRIRILNVRHDFDAVIAPAQRWVFGTADGNPISSTNPAIPLQYTFNTPTAAAPANQCGRVLFSDFHVANRGFFSGKAASPLTPQEKVFEYLIFDLSSCIQPDVLPPQTCTPRTCTQQGLNCGAAADGCGGTIASCGTCTAPSTCGGGGTPGVCGQACVPKTCAQLGFSCGLQGDGCGGSLDCGTCPTNQTCGGGGVPGVCGGTICVAKNCGQLGYTCGQQGDGCNGTQNCGTCLAPQTCGGGGVPGVCGGGVACVPKSCAQLGFKCGMQGDGCGGTQDCGNCLAPQTCGGGGVAGVCGGGGTCTPKNCVQQGFTCGAQGDGCGGLIDGGCGTCLTNELCGAGGPGVCGTVTCTPLTCMQQNIGCGPAGDGCGNLIQCGACPAGLTCGGGGVPGQCGKPLCTPLTCSQLGANCGYVGNGCGGTVNCGACTNPLDSCGGGGLANVCGHIL